MSGSSHYKPADAADRQKYISKVVQFVPRQSPFIFYYVHAKARNSCFLANVNLQDANGVITIKPRGLNVIWGADERYWKIDTKYVYYI